MHLQTLFFRLFFVGESTQLVVFLRECKQITRALDDVSEHHTKETDSSALCF